MFKKLLLVLALGIALIVGPIGGGAMAANEKKECTLIKGSKVIQVMSDKTMRGIVVPEDTDIVIGPKIPDAKTDELTGSTAMDWEGALSSYIMIDFGSGPVQVFLMVKPSDIKECN